MTLTSTPAPPSTTAVGRRLTWVVVAVTLLAVGVVYARVRWPGLLPVGSDNDEYQLAAQALARFEAPVIAGVEGTKYPLGYPLLLAGLERLGLPMARAALALNLVALGATVAMIATLAGRATATRPASPGAALAGGAVVITSVSVWNDVYSVMPELVLLTVVAGILLTLERPLSRRRLVVLTLLAMVAVALKTLAVLLVVGGCALWWLASRRDAGVAPVVARPGVATLVPAVGAVAVVLAGMALMRPLPEHTTGYLATFPLVDPNDASLGRAGPFELVTRTVGNVPEALADLGRAIAFIDAPTGLAAVVAIVGLSLGGFAAFRLRPGTAFGPFVAGMTLLYALGMAAWPYHSSRFGIPLVPVAALGVAWVVRTVVARGWPSVALGAVVLAMLTVSSYPALVDRSEAGREALAGHHAGLEELDRWASEELSPDDRLVSFDYREISHQLDRRVDPISYTTDPAALLAQVDHADLLIVMDIHPRRSSQAQTLLDAYPDRFEEAALEASDVDVYRIRN
jgi:hypothetical protein